MAKGPKGEVGYGKPPEHSKFKKGASGNPGGRPKGDGRTLWAEIANALDIQIPVTLGGSKEVATLRKAVAMAIVKKAAEGNLAAAALIDKVESRNAPPNGGTSSLFKDGEDVEYDIRLVLEDAPPRRPDRLEGVRIALLQHGDAIPSGMRERMSRMLEDWEFIWGHRNLIPGSLDYLTD